MKEVCWEKKRTMIDDGLIQKGDSPVSHVTNLYALIPSKTVWLPF